MEEFTFPSFPLEQCNAKNAPFPHFASPSPWLVVPGGVVDTASHEHDHRRTFSAVEQQAAGSDHHHHRHGSARFAVEDKMDMLWEDFNEELARAEQPCLVTKGTPSWAAAKESWLAGGDGYEGAAGAEARKHAVVRRRRMGLLMMLRLLKKLFLAHKSGAAPSRKTPPI
ncbi:hypothetical protein BS78_08G053700 [Paspalum vaginatum]|nr:hypothetical protein BS78_08G053700 [Paspalum vaginatum]